MARYTREQIFDRLKEILADDFEIEPEKLVPDANLFEDLELDSIDAVDLNCRNLRKRKFLRKILNRLKLLMMLLLPLNSFFKPED